jgi:hypothetical protein
MKFSTIQKGRRAERAIDLPGYEGHVPLLLRPITGQEEADVLRLAFEFAAQKGNEKPSAGDPLYDMGMMVHTLAIACLDTESPPDARTPFFDGGAKQILDELSRESIVHLYERQELWQDECSPYLRRMTSEDLIAKVAEVANSSDDAPFIGMSPATRWLFTRTTADLLQSYREGRLPFGAPAAEPS